MTELSPLLYLQVWAASLVSPLFYHLFHNLSLSKLQIPNISLSGQPVHTASKGKAP